MAYKINHADILDWAKNYDGEPFDGILCDPPYELGFMGKSWDSTGIAFNVELWTELLRICKPGAHLLAFSGSRTYHRMACAIEDAGFEIRDMIEWVYGSGFPKSLNIGKAVDKINGELGRLTKFTGWMRTTGLKPKQIDDLLKAKGMISPTSNFAIHYFNDGQPAIPTARMWEAIRPICGEIPQWVDELVERIEREREVVGKQTTNLTVMQNIGGTNISGEVQITKGTSEWEGYGTALKPAHEPCVLARKPIKGTVANNCLEHGTGGLNIDGTRVGYKNKDDEKSSIPGSLNSNQQNSSFGIGEGHEHNPTGRFPANLIHDGSDEVLEVFPQTKSGGGNKGNVKDGTGMFGSGKAFDTPTVQSDSGSAARFFYTAKASKSERNAGLEGFEDKQKFWHNHEGRDMTNPKNYIGGKVLIQTAKNHHPTVKPLSLTKYLATLIKPPKGGRLLVPFSGSGSEMIGALQAGWEYVEGVELTEEYIPIAEARIKHWLDKIDKQMEIL